MAEMRRRGRPRRFDDRAAVEAAMRLFWAAGYDGTSIDRLCRETGMPRASLYQSFGGKEALFLAAIEHYVGTRIATVAAALGPGGRLDEDLAAFFLAVVVLATADPLTPGCLISCVLADAAGAHERFRAELDRRYGVLERRIEARLQLDGWTDAAAVAPGAAAGMAAATARGIMLRARSGSTAAGLRPLAGAAVAALAALRGQG